jgi:hypothetical protein
MKIRISLGNEVPELKSAITRAVCNKAPLKRALIDTETLEIYKANNNQEIRK